ncbi:HIRAN domain-containing protein [Scrofimicrobium sp. R131]|uniref:HIRAN domain-containing protein n=1 Tax=Scrofimicrobium appendicitidis TaxID=3079930 RepID=A0AAU7V956_9ACTO
MPNGAELEYLLDTAAPRARLEEVKGQLLIVTDDGQRVNPGSPHLYKAGIFSFRLRGTSYYETAVKYGDFSPGTKLRLVREPDNEYDSNAIAIYAPRARNKAGYVNKLNAKRIAPLLDRGDKLVCISCRGTGPGRAGEVVPRVLVLQDQLLAQLWKEL